MTELLKTALSRVERLMDEEQDVLARIILDELQDEERWEKKLTGSLPVLGALAEEATREYHAGRTEPLEPDSL